MMFVEKSFEPPLGAGPQGFGEEEDAGGGKQIPLGPALIAWAVLAGFGGLTAFLVWLAHKFIVPIPFW